MSCRSTNILTAEAGFQRSTPVALFFRYRLTSLLCLLALSGIWAPLGSAQEHGRGDLLVTVQKELDQQSASVVEIFAQGAPTPTATTPLGVPVNLPAGTYRVVFDILNGKISRENVLVKAGRQSTVMENNLAGVRINVLDKNKTDLGVGVEIYDSITQQLLGTFLSGETILAHPGVVDLKISVPPQSQWIRKAELRSNVLSSLNFYEELYGELLVRPTLAGRDVSTDTQVIISRAGVNKEIARSPPGREHRFKLGLGTYEILVQNRKGSGRSFVQERVELKEEGTIEKEVELQEGSAPTGQTKQGLF